MMNTIGSGGDIRFTKEQLGQLYTKATQFNNTYPCYTNNITWFYRNQDPKYFINIHNNSYNTSMQVHSKDYTGDPKNPTNGRLAGLFFCANVLFSGGLPTSSPFGPERVKVPTHYMFNQGTNLYFADFYCMDIVTGADCHYVMLVMCMAGSASDTFCALNLFPLDKFNNDFLTLDRANGQAYIKNNAQLWVEVFYTEDIDLNTPGLKEQNHCDHNGHYPQYPGIPKTATCTICNL